MAHLGRLVVPAAPDHLAGRTGHDHRTELNHERLRSFTGHTRDDSLGAAAGAQRPVRLSDSTPAAPRALRIQSGAGCIGIEGKRDGVAAQRIASIVYDLHLERQGQWRSDHAGLVIPVDQLQIGCCAVARQHEIVAPAADQQGERDAEATEKT